MSSTVRGASSMSQISAGSRSSGDMERLDRAHDGATSIRVAQNARCREVDGASEQDRQLVSHRRHVEQDNSIPTIRSSVGYAESTRRNPRWIGFLHQAAPSRPSPPAIGLLPRPRPDSFEKPDPCRLSPRAKRSAARRLKKRLKAKRHGVCFPIAPRWEPDALIGPVRFCAGGAS